VPLPSAIKRIDALYGLQHWVQLRTGAIFKLHTF